MFAVECELPKNFWAEAVNMACYLINRSPRASLAGKVAEEVWTGHDVIFYHLQIFGCPAYVHVPADERSKLDAKLNKCIFSVLQDKCQRIHVLGSSCEENCDQ